LDLLISSRLAQVEAGGASFPAAVTRNLRLLQDRVVLTPVEEMVLVSRALLRTSDPWDETLSIVGGGFVSDSRLARLLGTAFCCSPDEVSHALRPDGALRAVGLVELAPKLGPFDCRLTPLEGLPNALMRHNSDVDQLIGFAANRAEPPGLTLDAYPHLAAEIELILDFLSEARKSGLVGINVLLHGTPGTGKTELVRAIAARLGWTLYEVATELPLLERFQGPASRFRRYRFLQQLLSSSSKTLVIFDEIEDVFRGGPFGDDKQPIPKAEINRALETNPVPAFWVSNRIDQVDPAYLRRFDLIIEVRSPPRSVRKRLLEDALGKGGTRATTIARIANASDLTPAVLARAARVTHHAGEGGDASIERLDIALKGFREATSAANDGGMLELPRLYDLGLVNASEPLMSVSAALAKHRKGRVLLHGPPGTGKTAFANFVAMTMDRPLLQKRASDIYSRWLGESEKNARSMFDEARSEGAILFLDEADSLLRERAGATGRWEGPIVNEILTGMESFGGVFICATNLPDVLDAASLRRFTFKIGFDWLRNEQRWRLLAESFPELNENATEAERQHAKQVLASLGNLAPGDYAVLREREQLGVAFGSLAAAVASLASECEHKLGGRRAIGF
ncbi:partial ATP-dependent zinc metalloprotease FtsH 3, partial [Planctomycetaceae bacterium]